MTNNAQIVNNNNNNNKHLFISKLLLKYLL